MPESNQEILKYSSETIILPISISRRNNYSVLNDYKIVKAVTNNMENKKAV
ncbi:MAG TPA: hypothetical protein OIM48_04505 [Clostridiaceae bacterium]|nr:hypothetical protein [Clostridiaceae bacterium]